MSAPAAKAFSRAGDDDAADAVIGLEGVERLVHLGQERRIEGVQGLGPIEGDQPHLAARLDEDRLKSHAGVSSSLMRHR